MTMSFSNVIALFLVRGLKNDKEMPAEVGQSPDT